MEDKNKNNKEYKIGCCKISCESPNDCKIVSGISGQKFVATNWLEGIDNGESDIFEIQFKNTRKCFYKNVNNLNLKTGDIVAVEASPGHDIGIVSLSGNIVKRQIKKRGIDLSRYEFKKIYRKARAGDIEKWEEAIALEHNTMIKSRQIAAALNLSMKIGDVEYQGDKTKAIFYYIADDRVDFRELIKVFAEEFHIRIEMKQIGARQEAGLIGGIGPCGRELCCSQWLSNFVSVSTGAARYQELSLNPQKLAGQCCKLKCCLNFETDVYIDAQKDFPKITAPLELVDGKAYLIKTDVLSRFMYFSYGPEGLGTIIQLPVDRVKELLEMNKKGIKIEKLEENPKKGNKTKAQEYTDAAGEESITRFDKSKNRDKQKNNATEKMQNEKMESEQKRNKKKWNKRKNKNIDFGNENQNN